MIKKTQTSSSTPEAGKVYVGKVKDNRDIERMGRIRVWIPELSQKEDNDKSWFTLGYCSPFGGATNINHNTNENEFSGTQKSYGMWFQAPDLNNLVMVVFASAVASSGFYIGCLFQDQMNHMIPGLGGDHKSSNPKAEYNKNVQTSNFQNPERADYGPLSVGLGKQGLGTDNVRGTSTSSVRRPGDQGSSVADNVIEGHVYQPSNANGILTPGGHQIVMDDGDGKGKSKMLRFRTTSGAQILISESDGMVYVINRDGTAWVELSQSGHIDMWAKKSVNVRAENNINLHADKNVNIEAGSDINIRANTGSIKIKSGKDYDLTVDKNYKVLVTGTSNVKIVDSSRFATKSFDVNTDNETVFNSGTYFNIKSEDKLIMKGSQIHLNGPKPKEAKVAQKAEKPVSQSKPNVSSSGQSSGSIDTVVDRMPTHEPYPEHD